MARFQKYVESSRLMIWLKSDGQVERIGRIDQRIQVIAPEQGTRREPEQHRSSSRANTKPSHEETFLDGSCKNELFHPFIAIDAAFTHASQVIIVYGILLTLFRWIIGLWTVITLPAICCISGIYCVVKAVKETVFWIEILLIHNKCIKLSDKGFFRYHVYLVADFIVTVALIGTGIGLEAGIGLKGCEYRKDSIVWQLAVFCMSMDAFIPHIAIVVSVLVLMCLCFVFTCSCKDK